METKLNTPLTADEIDFRVQSINKRGYATILAYKDARVDMNRLDAVYGVDGWQKKYDLINGNLFCSVGIWSANVNDWVWKQDVGTESNTEKEKGQASDAFKRACFNLGIGRELYDYPIISIKLEANEFEAKNDKVYPTFNFKLKQWKWVSEFKDGKLHHLKAIDNNGKVRFEFSQGKTESLPEPKTETKPKAVLTEKQATDILNACTSLDVLKKTFLTLTPKMQVKMESLKDKLKLQLTPKPETV